MKSYELTRHPENMTVIINIQVMEKKIGVVNPLSFAELEQLSFDELFKIQESLIPRYNQVVKEKL